MKNLFSTLLFAISFITISTGQDTQPQDIQNLRSNKLIVESEYLDMKIDTWDKNYILIESDVKINMGMDNDAHVLKTENTSDGILIRSKINTDKIQKMVIVTDKEGNKTYTPIDEWDENMKGKHFNRLNFGFEIDGSLTIRIPENLVADLESLYGDMTVNGTYNSIMAHSTYGLIESRLSEVSKMETVSFESTYDIVDLALDKNSSANLNLHTSYGSVFTDLPLQSQHKSSQSKHHECYGSSGKYVLNNGDVNIDIVATYDNIYVRSY